MATTKKLHNTQKLDNLLSSFGIDLKTKTKTTHQEFSSQWSSFIFNKPTNPALRVFFIDTGGISGGGGRKFSSPLEVRKSFSKFDLCIAIFHTNSKYYFFLKANQQQLSCSLDNDLEFIKFESIINTCEFSSSKDKFDVHTCISKAIKSIPTQTSDFNNRGIFSTHYIKTRFFNVLAKNNRNVENEANVVSQACTHHLAKDILVALGWKNLTKNANGSYVGNSNVSIIVADVGVDLGTKTSDNIAPSYKAVSELQHTPWVILTNGKIWRLYTNKISASTTNYFEINLALNHYSTLLYFVAIFSQLSYLEYNGKTSIDLAFEEGKTYASEVEEDLASKILQTDGIFLDLVKGILNHDRKIVYTLDELESAKDTALKVMYRILFLLYAESRDLLPVKDSQYRPMSLQSIKNDLDRMENIPNQHSCWELLVQLFAGICNGSKKHNLPRYNGDLFAHDPSIDDITIKNRFMVHVLRGLFEKDGESLDYANLNVRHLGSIYETLMEFSVKQADKDIMLIEDSKGIREVESSVQSTYSYKKNDLYLASKTGIASRKNSGSYYTPEKLVEFLVSSGLKPIFADREMMIEEDVKKYIDNPNDANKHRCVDRLLDIQVLDPSMGSGHFLVESLNAITIWITGILEKYSNHPLLNEIETDRRLVISEQTKNGIKIDQSLLTYDVLLKRKVMKRCIFGVDSNRLAVELTRLSLWLDSFAIGVPLTYLNHHIKVGDSTIGMWRSDLQPKMHSLDDWIKITDKVGDIITEVSTNSDVTINDVHKSKQNHDKYEDEMFPHKSMLNVLTASKIDRSIIPKNERNAYGFIKQFGHLVNNNNSNEISQKQKYIQKLSKEYNFFHWELEMMDAFTDSRRGFDLIVGNPPWDKVISSDDEFFTRYDPTFRSLPLNTIKKKRMNKILKNHDINKSYNLYKEQFHSRSTFYKIYKLQGKGVYDLWQIMVERILDLVAKNGIISIVIPSQILSNNGCAAMRKDILEKNILSLYVFENKQKIFPIHSSYKFVLLTMRNESGSDNFPSGFYLHNLSSLKGNFELDKFGLVSKKVIKKISPTDYAIPEIVGDGYKILLKLSKFNKFNKGLTNGWNISITFGFNKTTDSDILTSDGRGWPVIQGGNIHQFMHNYIKHELTTKKINGLRREKKRRIYANNCENIFNSFRLMFRDISGPTNVRTIIASIIPPQQFFTYSLQTIVLTHNHEIRLDNEYNKKIAYLCGILNSMTFDYVARSKIQMHASTIVPNIPIPNPSSFDNNIINLAVKLSIGSSKFKPFADMFNIDNVMLSPKERIHITAQLDAFVAHAYTLNRQDYQTIINSFKFGTDSDILTMSNVCWSDNRTMRNFYGEVRKLVLGYYDQYNANSEVSIK